MDKNITFFSDEAERLNVNIHKHIASHLFLTCNYDPTSVFVPNNENSRFFAAVLNMYKFLIDSGICNNLKTFEQYLNYQELNYIIKIISALRTIMGHNLSELNGNDEDKKYIEQWVLKVLGKKCTSAEEEYKKLLDSIKGYGNKSVQILDGFVNNVSQVQGVDKCKVIKEWEKLIIKFYKRDNTKKILEGQLKIYYRSRVGSVKQIENHSIAYFVKEMLTFEDQIQNLNSFQERFNNKPENEVLKQINERLKTFKEKRASNMNQVAQVVEKEPSELGDFDYYNYYLRSELPVAIENKIMNNSNNTSLLPQDIVQEILDEHFKDVPI